MPSAERSFDWLLGLSVWSWAILGPLHAPAEDRFTVVRLCISALHLLVGWLVIRRRPLGRLGSRSQLLAALPALVISGLALAGAGPPSLWPPGAQGLFVVGTVLVLVSLGFLGDDFAILPALRGVTRTGPYRWIRHPAYLGELIMVSACTLAAPLAWFWTVALAVPFVLLRIQAEERLLARSAAWCEYRDDTRWRLLPGVW